MMNLVKLHSTGLIVNWIFLSLNRVMNPDIHQMSQPQISLPSEQFPFTEGPGIKSFTFDEIYSSGLSIKDADGAGTDEGSLWQVTWPCVSVW
jgi:calmodulin-binding transcription activator